MSRTILLLSLMKLAISMSPGNTPYLLGVLLNVFFAVGSAVIYRMALDTKDRLLARLSVLSFALSCVGAAVCFGGAVFVLAQ